MHPDWLGSPQHFVAGAILAAVVVLAGRRLTDAPTWLLAALAIGTTMTAEAAVELVEYPLRYADTFHETAYYDTLADLAASLAGAGVGTAAALLALRARRSA